MERMTAIEIYEQKRERIRKFNLVSDLFAAKVFEDLTACQELCRILMRNPNLQLKDVKTQYVIRNLEGHSVQLDILAEELTGSLINVELQMYKEEAPFRRSRYYMSCIDMSILGKGKAYYELPSVTVLYITRTDFIGGKKGLYQIRRKTNTKSSLGIDLDNGLCEKYFNLRYPTRYKSINELLRYLENSDPFYRTKVFPRIVERVKFFKVQEEGVDIMCEIADRIKMEGKIEGKIEVILELLEELGKVPSKIVERISRETDLVVLGRWIKCAASATSITEFEGKM